jgi:Zn-dependent M28 family amino/carboxypeptidase
VAHVDSKWQPVSMIARVAGVVVVTVGWLALLIELVVGASGWEPLALVWIGAVPLLLSFVGRGARNHGALDNASGVAAVLEAAALLPRDGTRPAAVGVLITDAEELALAGSRAWARARRTGPSIALNCDSIDDRGPLTVMHHRGRSRALADDLDRVARSCKEPLRVIPLLPGILTDSVALAAAGWRTVTLSRGTVRTLDRIHTSRDTLAAMAGSGITGTARVLARTVVEVMDAGNGTNAKRVMEPD